MVTGCYTLPPPATLKRFKWTWNSYTLATVLSEKSEEVQVVTLLTVIEEAREVYSTFRWDHEGDHKKSKPVLAQGLLACYGIPNVLMTDNEPQFHSAEFGTFASQWRF